MKTNELVTKLANSFEGLAKQQSSTEEYMLEIASAQNKLGVLAMTLLQMLAEKDLLDADEVLQRLEKNSEDVLSKDGDCAKPLSSLLEKGTDDES